MTYKKIFSAAMIFFSAFCFQQMKAQSLSINGDTLFVNREAEVQIVLPTLPTDFFTTPSSSQFNVWQSSTGINIIAAEDDSTPVNLTVAEAGRKHLFILLYKSYIPRNETKLYYDYSSVAKLSQHISRSKYAQQQRPKQVIVASTAELKENKNETEKANQRRIADSISLLKQQEQQRLITQKEMLKQQQRMKDSTANEEKLLAAKNKYFQTVIAVPPPKPATAAPSPRADSTKKIVGINAAPKEKRKNPVNNDTVQVQALLKPIAVESKKSSLTNDLSKPSQSADTILSEETKKKLYPFLIARAKTAFKKKDWGNAKIFYEEAQKIIPSAETTKQLQLVNDKLTAVVKVVEAKEKIKTPMLKDTVPVKVLQKPIVIEIKKSTIIIDSSKAFPAADNILSEEAKKKLYPSLIARAKAALTKNDWSNAKKNYEEAQKLRPTSETAKQLKLVNDKLTLITKEEETNKNSERLISTADSLTIAKKYLPAMEAYTIAMALNPADAYPGKQIKYIQFELVQLEKRKKEEKEKTYNDAIAKADKAVADKNYEAAKTAYTEALTIHPDNEYAKRRLDIILYQIKKTNAEKQILVPAPEEPVKKSKRKRG